MTTTGSGQRCPVLPAGLHLGRGDGRLPDRGRGARRRPGPVDLGHLQPPARQGPRRRHRRRRLRLLPPLPRGRRADGVARPERLPVLDLLAAGPAGRPRRGEPEGPRLLPGAARRACRAAASPPRSRSITGTCRRNFRTRAAGRCATPPSGSPSTRRSSPRRSATGSPAGSRSTSRRSWPATATAPACTPRACATPPRRPLPRITCCSATAWPPRRCAPRHPAPRSASPRPAPGPGARGAGPDPVEQARVITDAS